MLAAGFGASPNLKQIRGSSGGTVVPIGKGTIASLQQLYRKAIQTCQKPAISLSTVVMLKNDRSVGSGFVIASNRLILTNRHVTAGGSRRVQITAEGGIKTQGEVIYVDRKLDLALMRAEGLTRLKLLPLCYASHPKHGQALVALDSTLGLAGTVT